MEVRRAYNSGAAVGRNGEFLVGVVVPSQKIYKQ